ncbi:hypothetical protein V8E36_009643 [Tilletia maclaganii]
MSTTTHTLAHPPSPSEEKKVGAHHDPPSTPPPPPPPGPVLDIEHQIVDDDPRLWSDHTKMICVFTLMLGALSPTLGANIFYPALSSLEDQLNATTATISLSVSLYILFQGTVPLIWSSISELIGRKRIFIAGSLIFAITSLICGLANSMALLIAMRCISAIGSSPMLSIGAGTLADMYEPHERGAKVGLYYSAPLLAPAISPIIGGALTEASSWRATFYFLAAAGVAMFLSFTFLFKETFRPERSLAWTQAKERALRRAEGRVKQDNPKEVPSPRRQPTKEEPGISRQSHAEEAETTLTVSRRSSEGTIVTNLPAPAPSHSPPPRREGVMSRHREGQDEPFEPPRFFEPPALPPSDGGLSQTVGFSPQVSRAAGMRPMESRQQSALVSRTRSNRVVVASTGEEVPVSDLQSDPASSLAALTDLFANFLALLPAVPPPAKQFKPSFADVNPLRPLLAILSEPHNIVSLLASGLSFGSFYSLMLTLSRDLAAPPQDKGYGYSPIIVGVVLLSIGGGGMLGSTVGGRLSDRRIRRVKSGALVSPLVSPSSVEAHAWRVRKRERERAENDGALKGEGGDLEVGGGEGEEEPVVIVEPEERILSCALPMLLVPICYIAYAWAVYYTVPIAAVCVILVLLGTAQFSVYACTLSYVVDSNKGRGSSAVACNSAFRGSVAFVASEIASYLLRAMGNGWLYTGWAIALGLTQVALFFVAFQARRWRTEGFKFGEQDWRFLRRHNWKA